MYSFVWIQLHVRVFLFQNRLVNSAYQQMSKKTNPSATDRFCQLNGGLQSHGKTHMWSYVVTAYHHPSLLELLLIRHAMRLLRIFSTNILIPFSPPMLSAFSFMRLTQVLLAWFPHFCGRDRK
ncbi:hypothetical protein V1478_011310 [Vespula squamosa]|uniref:Secreted protein n=1 Tax=Vespula squamosa TaxID=30214 RepID=A0ABD2AE52_VESSQ